MEHQPYSPDLAPNDYWLFPKLKSAEWDEYFRIMKTSKKNMTTAMTRQICDW
jgi:hypothetical protein